jgi:hypothetical protein
MFLVLLQTILLELTTIWEVFNLFNLDSNFFEFINNITGNLNMNIQFSNNDISNRNHVRIINNNVEYFNDDNSSFESNENSVVSLNLDENAENQAEAEENEEEAYRELLIQKRGEIIDDLNVFQFKNVSKFITRIDEYFIC